MVMIFQRQPDDPQKYLLWTRSMMVAAVAAGILLAVSFVPIYKASQQPPISMVTEKINPNTAPLGSLVRLPNIGKARALDIIHYRTANAAGMPVFQSTVDLEKINGIGPKTAEAMAPYLTFETTDVTE